MSKNMTEYLPRLIIDNWVWSHEARNLDKFGTFILKYLEVKKHVSDEETVTKNNLMALLKIGSNHGDEKERRSLTYITWHLLIMRDIDFQGEPNLR